MEIRPGSAAARPSVSRVHRLGRNRPLAGRYVLADRIGVGGMGAVWRARDLRTGNWVAAKVLGRHDAELLLRFVHEQAVRIAHPHVLAPTGWAAEDDVVVLTMDLVRGGSVADVLADHGVLPEPLVRVLLDQMLRGLGAVHAAGIVHRDVKPANLLLEATGRGRPQLRVADFGIAASAEEHRWTGAAGPLGTEGYLAPEHFRGAPPDPRQDVYAAGVVAVELLTGRRPPPRHGAPNGPLRPLLEAMTEPDPARRTPSVGAALHHLRRLGVPQLVDVDLPDRLGDPPGRWRRRWPLVG